MLWTEKKCSTGTDVNGEYRETDEIDVLHPVLCQSEHHHHHTFQCKLYTSFCTHNTRSICVVVMATNVYMYSIILS